ncbi:acyltransferase [Plectonema cf. radiosum LEGE 06105]|uniref:Acyltransferase n=1 Tax=Plectonema cf. radiosum LEGE 06105 TaxID=945769 RepID=A0A8J7F799_9CYAN|nr:acyltransferase [Plectonema radiosum]MBE9213309.1 acyltransferase [Plectonema cf. radiosum LEGE 06105]
MKSEIALKTIIEKPKIHFQFIEGLRGFGALWVVLRHSDPDGRISQFTNTLPQWLVDIVFRWGRLGVAIFFVLSGFVIAYSLQNIKIDFAYFKNFVLRRFVRLSPAYYLSILMTLAIAFIASYFKGERFAPMGQPLSLPRFVAHLFYLQDILKLQHIDDVYWTLCLEVQFSLVFCILLSLTQSLDSYWKNNWGKFTVFIPSAIFAALFPMGVFKDYGRPTIFLPLWYSFILGVFAYWTWRNYLKLWFFYFYAGLLISVAIFYSSGFTITSSITAILLLEVGRANRMQDFLNWQWLQFLGKISYSLYLTHISIIGAIYYVGYKLFDRYVWSEFLCLIVGIVTCISIATLMWYFVEKPSINWSKKLKAIESLKA